MSYPPQPPPYQPGPDEPGHRYTAPGWPPPARRRGLGRIVLVVGLGAVVVFSTFGLVALFGDDGKPTASKAAGVTGVSPAAENAEADPDKDLGAGEPNAPCATNRLGKSFVKDGVTYTCSKPKPYRWRADPYEVYLTLAPKDAPKISREDAQTRALLGCGQSWAPGTVDAALAEAYALLCKDR